MKHGITIFFALAVGLGGCGSNTPSAENAGHEHEEHGEHEEHHIAGPAAEFHEILAPIWHSAEGPERLAKACDSAQAMHDKAAAVEAAPAPEGAKADDYKAAAKDLTASVDAMAAECKKDTKDGVAARLSAVHDAFHKVADMAHPHDEHGEHEHGEKHEH